MNLHDNFVVQLFRYVCSKQRVFLHHKGALNKKTLVWILIYYLTMSEARTLFVIQVIRVDDEQQAANLSEQSH